MAHFEVGKKVIAIRTHSKKAFVRGQVFELNGIRKPKCMCKSLDLDIGMVNSEAKILSCTLCGNQENRNSDIWWFNSAAFAPYDDSLSELTAEHILEETPEHSHI